MTKQKGSENYQTVFTVPRTLEICVLLIERRGKFWQTEGDSRFHIKLQRINANFYRFIALRRVRVFWEIGTLPLYASGYLRRADHNSTEVGFNTRLRFLVQLIRNPLLPLGLIVIGITPFIGTMGWLFCTIGTLFMSYRVIVWLWSQPEPEDFALFIDTVLYVIPDDDPEVFKDQYFEQE